MTDGDERDVDPVCDDKQRVRSQFGKNAANYVTSPVHAKGASLQRLVALSAPRPDWVCLDIATAAGHTAFAFAAHVTKVVASDITPEMLDRARELAGDRGIDNVDFAVADAERLPFADAAFDLVSCRIAPHHFSKVAKFMSEVARVLKSGGTLALCDNLSPDHHTNPELDEVTCRSAAQAYNAFEQRRDPSHVYALTHGEWLNTCNNAGLAVRCVEHVAKPMSFDRWCHNMSVAPTLRDTLRGDLEAASAGLAAFLKPAKRDDDIAFELTEIVLIADKP